MGIHLKNEEFQFIKHNKLKYKKDTTVGCYLQNKSCIMPEYFNVFRIVMHF